MSKTKKGILSVNFVLEVIVDAADVKTYLLREPHAMQPLSMTTEPSVVLDAVEVALKSFQNLRKGVQQG